MKFREGCMNVKKGYIMNNIFKILFCLFINLCLNLFSSVPVVGARPVYPQILLPKTTVPVPVATAMAPVVAQPVQSIAQPKVAPIAPVAAAPVVAPKVLTPAQPTVAPGVAPKALAPVAQPVTAPVVQLIGQPIAQQIETPQTAVPLNLGTLKIENTSQFPAQLSGWKIKYKTQDGIQAVKKHTLTPSATLPIFNLKKKKGGTTVQLRDVSVNLPVNAFFEGYSDLIINGSPISVVYKDSLWMPGTTDKIYVTSPNGSDWSLDIKAMDKSYQKINSGSLNVSPQNVSTEDDSVSKVTNTTKAAAVSLVQQGQGQTEFKNIQQDLQSKKQLKSSKVSKAAKSPRVALKAINTNIKT